MLINAIKIDKHHVLAIANMGARKWAATVLNWSGNGCYFFPAHMTSKSSIPCACLHVLDSSYRALLCIQLL